MKLFYCSILLFSLTYYARAQIHFHGNFSVSGISSQAIQAGSVNTFTIGSGVNHTLGSRFLLRGELNFSKKGYRYQQPTRNIVYFYYLSLPVTVAYQPIPFLSVEAGIETAYLFDAKFLEKRSQRIKVWDTYKSLDIGLVAGLTFFSSQPLNIYVRYIHGVRNLLEYPGIDNFGNFVGEINDVQNRALQIGLRLNVYWK